jgi:eukaryotic-like serine/threonine-protein kinase
VETASNPLAPRHVRALPAKLGRYTLFSHIGRGGMANIYLASAETDLGARRLVVIKEVIDELAHDAKFADMLVAEAKLAAELDHTNVVKVEDLGRDGTLFIAMEYVEGVDLREMLRRCAKAKLALPVEFSLRIVSETLSALRFAHRFRDPRGAAKPVVHRDVSPSNVLLSFEGEVKLCDFGIARANPLATPAAPEMIQGKAGYMSPEQARGDAVDARSDVFAAGIILWELLCGRRLYKAKEGEKLLTVAQRAEVPPLSARGLPLEEELYAIVARALERDPEARWQSADAMLRAVEDYAMRAQLVASPLRFGAWLSDHFGADVIDPRRAGERAMRALALGPPAVLEPIEPVTPSTFMVTARAPEELPVLTADTSREDPTVVPPKVAMAKPEQVAAKVVPLPSASRHVVFWMVAAAAFLALIGSAVHAFAG